MEMLLASFTIGGVIANSSMDQSAHNFYQDNIRSEATNNFVDTWRPMGQSGALILYGSLGAFCLVANDSEVGEAAGELLFKSGRAFAVGTIPLHIMKQVTGGSRPVNSQRSSYWKPFTLRHGVSGDTYTAAIFFINLAKMTDNIYWKSFFYTVSTFGGIGRINDECHYPSQVFLGWMMAYAACDAVWHTDSKFNLSAGADRVAFGFEF